MKKLIVLALAVALATPVYAGLPTSCIRAGKGTVAGKLVTYGMVGPLTVFATIIAFSQAMRDCKDTTPQDSTLRADCEKHMGYTPLKF